MIDLFRHNKEAYEAAVRMLAERGKAAVIHPTGTGKSFIGFKLCEDNPEKTICWLSPSRYIYQTQLENIREVSNDYSPDNVKFYTYAKLMLMSEEEITEIQPDYIILDEYHRVGAEQWGQGVDNVLKMYPDAPVLGLSATAIRYLDNQRNMTEELLDGNIASEMTLGESIVRGILAPPKYILSIFSYQKDLEKYEKRAATAKSKAVREQADKYLEALRRALDKAEKLDELFDRNMTDRTGKYIVFCANLEHMQDMMSKAKEWFCKVDRKPHIYSVYSDDPTASKSFAAFKVDDDKKHMKLLYCIDALNEGVHVPDISGVILLRPTISPIIYKQQIGRALSASKSHDPVIFDIVNNIENLYSIDTIKEEMKVAICYYHSLGKDSYIVNESFELLDKVVDCKELFEQLEGTLSASWDIMYGYVKEYYEEHGNLEISKRYYTKDGYSLGSWLMTQRRVYNGTRNGTLTQVQIDKLNAIGMRWESASDVAWEKYYAAAERYYQANGNLKPTATYIDDQGVDLGRWLSMLRTFRKNGIRSNILTTERITELDKIGMIWDVIDYLWEENYAAAVRYHKKYGNLNVPVDYVDDNGIKLGIWLSNLKTIRKGTRNNVRLTEEQIERLNELGMLWGSKLDKRWNDTFDELCAYKEKYKSFDIPVAYTTDTGISLGVWIRRQRDSYAKGKLSDEHRQKLEDIGFDLKKYDPWEQKYQLAKTYYEEHGDLNVPSSYIVNGVWLNKWLNEQKLRGEGKKTKKLTDEQKSKLSTIGMKFGINSDDAAWMKNYEKVRAYYEEYHALDMKGSDDSASLKRWLLIQRKKRKDGLLNDEQISSLDAVEFVWEIDDGFSTGFEHAKRYFEAHGDLLVANSYVCPDGYKLGIFISNQRHKYSSGKMENERIQMLESISMVWNVLKYRWDTMYGFAHEYFFSHGDLKIPKGTLAENGSDLFSWVQEQNKNYKKGKLDDEQINLLRKIGFGSN